MQENGILRALNFKFSWGSMPPSPPTLLGANHLCKILRPPLRAVMMVAGQGLKMNTPNDRLLAE